MGCDYYIAKNLFIYYKDKSSSYIPLSRENCYFYYPDIDEDAEDYDKQYKVCINEQLKPRLPPMVIYSNHHFNSVILEEKYKGLIEKHFYNNYTNKSWADIVNITKEEMRYERE